MQLRLNEILREMENLRSETGQKYDDLNKDLFSYKGKVQSLEDLLKTKDNDIQNQKDIVNDKDNEIEKLLKQLDGYNYLIMSYV